MLTSQWIVVTDRPWLFAGRTAMLCGVDIRIKVALLSFALPPRY